MRDTDRLVRMATSNHGLLTTNDLRAVGLSRTQQARLVRSGWLQPARRGVLRLAGAARTWEQDILAICLTPGVPPAASHRSAMRIWTMRTRFSGLEVAVPYPKNRCIPGVIVHRSVDLIDADITIENGIPVTTPARTLCDAGLIFPDREIQRLVDHSIAIGLVTRAELIEVRRRVGEHGRNGVVRLDEAVTRLPTGAEETDSGPEVDLLRVLQSAGLPAPTRQHPVKAAGRRYRIDLSYPEVKLALEYDGVDAHTRVERFVDDRRRQNDLVLCGWTILRYTNADLRDRPFELTHQVRRALDDL